MVTLDPPPPQLQVTYAAAQNRLRRSLEALETAIAALVPFRGHKSLVMISEGFVLSPSVKEAYQRVTEAAQLARVAVYLVDPQGLTSGLPTASGGSATSATEREGQMGGTMEVVHATGGRQFSSNDLTLGIRQALRESEVYYLLGYPKPPGGKKKRDVRIRALGEGLEVLAPRRRYASDPAAMAERVAAAEDRVYDETGLPLQVRALAGAIDETGAVETTLAVAVGPSGATSPEAVTFTIEARREGRSLVRGELSQELPLSEGRSLVRLGFAFAPGLWQARVTASVRGGALRASALHTFEVAEGGPLRVSTPILSDVLDAEGEPRLRMDPVFSRQSPLYCGVRVWGVGGGAVSVRYVLRVEGGDRVEEGLLDTRPSGAGPLLASASWPPGTLASGRYLLEVRAAAEPEGLSSAVREVFEVR